VGSFSNDRIQKGNLECFVLMCIILDIVNFCFHKIFIAHYLDRSNLLGGRRREENMSVCLFVYMYVYVLMYLNVLILCCLQVDLCYMIENRS